MEARHFVISLLLLLIFATMENFLEIEIENVCVTVVSVSLVVTIMRKSLSRVCLPRLSTGEHD